MTVALLSIDMINECVHPDGKLSDKGFADFAVKHDVLQRVARIQEHFREQGGLVVHVRTGFSANYPEHPPESPILGPMREMEALKLGTWGTEFPAEVAPRNGEPVLTKHRMGPFYRSRLEIILRTQKVTDIYIVGLATMGSVALSAMEAHDRDFNVTVIEDGCIDHNEERHQMGLEFVSACAEVKEFKDVAVRLTMASMRGGI